jgi:hypothetical protein
MAYNLFRIAAILQGIAKRVEAGTASSAQAKASGDGARPWPRWPGLPRLSPTHRPIFLPTETPHGL